MRAPLRKKRAVILLNEDPRTSKEEYLHLQPEIIDCELIAYVAPDELLPDKKNYYYNGHGTHPDVPLVSWEEPDTNEQRAQQYCDLFQICKADLAIHLGWPYTIPSSGEANIFTVRPIVFKDLSGEKLSRLLHVKIHGLTPAALTWRKLLERDD